MRHIPRRAARRCFGEHRSRFSRGIRAQMFRGDPMREVLGRYDRTCFVQCMWSWGEALGSGSGRRVQNVSGHQIRDPVRTTHRKCFAEARSEIGSQKNAFEKNRGCLGGLELGWHVFSKNSPETSVVALHYPLSSAVHRARQTKHRCR